MNGIMKVAAGIALTVGMLAAPPASLAEEKDPINCTEGCEIVTCTSAGVCTVWECNSSGCEPVGFYTRTTTKRQQSQVQGGPKSKHPPAFSKVCEAHDPCAIKVCEAGKCEISVFDGTRFVPAAVTDDVGHLIDTVHRQLDTGRRSER